MVVGNDELDAGQAAFLQAQQKLLPAALAFAVGYVNGQHLPLAVPVDADGDQDRLMGDDAAVALAFVAGVEDEIWIGFVEAPMGEARRGFVQPLVDAADGAGREAVAA